MNTPQTIRSNIMEFIFKLDDVKMLETIYQQMTETVDNVQFSEKESYDKITDEDILSIAKEPIPEYLTAEQIEVEQGGFSMEKFGEALDDLNRDLYKDETLEEMLNAIN